MNRNQGLSSLKDGLDIGLSLVAMEVEFFKLPAIGRPSEQDMLPIARISWAQDEKDAQAFLIDWTDAR